MSEIIVFFSIKWQNRDSITIFGPLNWNADFFWISYRHKKKILKIKTNISIGLDDKMRLSIYVRRCKEQTRPRELVNQVVSSQHTFFCSFCPYSWRKIVFSGDYIKLQGATNELSWFYSEFKMHTNIRRIYIPSNEIHRVGTDMNESDV